MRIVVNARMLSEPYTGIGQFSRIMLSELARQDENNEYVILVHKEVPDEVKAAFGENVTVEVLAEKKFGGSGMRKLWWEQITVPEYMMAVNADVAFFTYPANPWSKDFYKKGMKSLVVVHDCIPWLHKDYSKKFLSRMYHSQTRKAVRLADEVVTVSEASGIDVHKVCKVPEEKISVVYNAVSEGYKGEVAESDAAALLEELGLRRDRFFLYVGGYDKRKNVGYLLKEYEALNSEIPLVLAGGKLYESGLYSSFDTEVSGVVKTGFLEEEKLKILYSQCLAFASFSTLEGFNLPILEAANCGAPLLVSDTVVHREVAEDSAVFVNILKEGAGTEAMKKVLNEEYRGELQEKSQALASKYSVVKSAQQLKKLIYE